MNEFFKTYSAYSAIAGHTFSVIAVDSKLMPKVTEQMKLYLSGARFKAITDAELNIYEGLVRD